MQSTVSVFLICTVASCLLAQQIASDDDLSADKRVRQFAFAKRSPYRTFAFAKRGVFDEEDEQVASDVDKRARFAFAKRGYRTFAFAKRASPYGFAFAKRGMNSFA
ncbi:unnamed protein product [Auanema sp. JU1783]|nr:unnamed protein product [Auanema sp. JU1783]